ncbi:Ppx/GppA family phosphatase [Georgenia thermotolerans]|uniref:Ppx/GppA family phosphatase n=1 Tax=Georgenia thermotolerans TaxID=527326 RepID=A0A7J5UL76_9MICO|nr:Ppx/GppA family phosphatase [Georgenia thermotolerans]KAE8763021.1 Ppx/GppA family phosphatase [Georgenia thermotolerans]
MRLGVLDIGSNTVHLLVVDAVRDGRPDPAADDRSTVRLMRYLDDEGRIDDDGVAALSEAVRKAAKAAKRLGAEELVGIATSAIREAVNGPEVLARLEEIAGVPLQVLSGRQEAELTFLAARRWHGWAAGRLLVLDIGGGSLEIAMGLDERPDYAVSVPLGAGRLTHDFLRSDPATDKQLDALKSHIKKTLAPVAKEIRKQPAPDHVVATSKTFRSLARLAGQRVEVIGPEERRRMQRADLADWTPRLAKIPAEQRMELPGITPERTYQIVAGAMVAQRAMKDLGVEEIEICPWALREGVLLRRLDVLTD